MTEVTAGARRRDTADYLADVSLSEACVSFAPTGRDTLELKRSAQRVSSDRAITMRCT